MQPTRIEKNKSKSGCILKAIFLLIILSGLLFLAVLFFGKRYYDNLLGSPLSEASESITFVIEPGTSIDAITQSLIDQQILDETSAKAFNLYITLNNMGNAIQAGTFTIPKDLTIIELVETLQNAGIPEVWVTFPEGLRADEIADILEQEFGSQEYTEFNKETFLLLTEDPNFIASLQLNGDPTSLEGFLFPDRYLIPLQLSEQEIITMMVDNFKSKVGSDYMYEEIITASLLEREGRNVQEKRNIADIIYRRLNEGWFLNIDATLLYYHGDWEHVLTEENLNTDHEYNTYTRLGLTPTPIANPGLDSISAAQNPTENPYYYYIHDADGIIHYATTWEEHAQNVSTYLR